MQKTRTYELSAKLHCLLGSILCIYVLIFIPESYHFVDVVWMLIIILHTFFTLGSIWGTGILIFSLIGSLYYLIFVLQTNLEMVNHIETEQVIALSINFSICMLIIAYFIRQFLKVNAHAEKKYIELTSTLKDKNEEKTVLLKEIHHRVKNNLQVITSLLRLQSKDITDEKYLNLYEESINRVTAMSRIHDKIFQNEDLAKIDLEKYVRMLVKDLIQSYSLRTKIDLQIRSDVDQVGAKSLVPIALIFNELISNSFKHAFNNLEEGVIIIDISKNDVDIVINYSDNGQWNSDIRPNSLGLELIDSLTGQLNGTLEREIDNQGTSYEFKFRKEDLD
jgi:two-component sensor histidine kinase